MDLAADGVADAAESAPAVEPAPVAKPAPTADPTPEELLAAAQTPVYDLYAPQASFNAPVVPVEETAPVTVKQSRAAKVFKWSAIIAVASFFLFGLCLETLDPEAESFIAGLFAVWFLLGGLTAAVSGLIALVNRLRG